MSPVEEGETPEELYAEIEADYRSIHQYAGSESHPYMKARVDGDAADHMELVERYAALRAVEPPPCPHVRTSREGTSYCTLAESGGVPRASEPALDEGEVEELREMLAGYNQIFVEQVIRAATLPRPKPGAADAPTEEEEAQ